MKNQTTIFFYVLSTYVVLQFLWWGFHLIELSNELAVQNNTNKSRIFMVIGEGSVFFLILLLGLWKIRTSIQKDIQLSQRQSNFLLSVTHELKTPLASNKLYLQTLLKHQNLDPNKQEKMLKEALNSSNRLESMIENILTATRLDNHKLELVKAMTNLSDEVNRVCQKWEIEHFKIEKSITSNISAMVDVFVLETVLVNLLDNSLKYAGKEAQISVSLQEKDGEILLSVADNGVGIPDKFKKEIFKKFTRIGNEETRTQKGTGLGLYIVSELLSFHGGEIEVKDRTGGGSIFEIRLS